MLNMVVKNDPRMHLMEANFCYFFGFKNGQKYYKIILFLALLLGGLSATHQRTITVLWWCYRKKEVIQHIGPLPVWNT